MEKRNIMVNENIKRNVKEKLFIKKGLKYKKITRLGREWIKQMEIYMKNIEKSI